MTTPARDDRARLLPVGDLLDLALALITRADSSQIKLMRRALWHRDGLMIAILCSCAPRASNLAGVGIGHNLQRRGEDWWLCYDSSETKNGRPLEVPLPALLNQPINDYLVQYRPVLEARSPSAAGDAFWLSYRGLPLTAKEVGQRISAVTRRELGKDLNPHLFRKMIPTELAIRDPEHVGAAQAILGHAGYATTERAYNLARSIDAARRVQAALAERRRQGQASRRGGR